MSVYLLNDRNYVFKSNSGNIIVSLLIIWGVGRSFEWCRSFRESRE